jgi:GNAT superfamily N-acetyltransferase
MSSKLQVELRPLTREHTASFCRLVVALAEFEKLPAPDEAAQERLVEDALGSKPRIEVWLAFVNDETAPCGYLILVETYSSFLALPTLYIEDVFVLPERRSAGVGGSLLRKAVALAHERNCGRVEWTALDWNVNAQRVYEQRMGAKRMSEWFLYRMTRDDMDRFLSASGGQSAIAGTSISE